MTEYGVQTNNLFDLLNVADEAAKPAAAKPKNRRKKSQRGKGPAAPGQASGQPSQPAKPAGSPAPRRDAQPGAQPRPAGQQQPARATTVAVSGGRGSATGPRPGGNAPAPAAGGGSQRGNGPAPAARSNGPNQGNRPQQPRQNPDQLARRFDDSGASFDEPKGQRQHAPRQAPARGREFDRQSGTGRSPTENKKSGGGGANWGTLTGEDELAAEEDAQTELKADSPEAQKEEKKKKKKKGKKPEEEETAEKKDEIPDEQLKTLEDYEKERAAKAAKLVLPKARKAGEGVKEDPTWSSAVKLNKDAKEEAFLKPKEEGKGKEPEDSESKKPSKSALRKKKKKEKKEQEVKKLVEENITTLFDFSAKKEEFGSGRGRGRGPRGPPREGGSGRGPREGGSSRGPREGCSGRGPREGGSGRGPRAGSARGNQPKKYSPGDSEGPQFDDSAFPALQVGPPPITAD